MRIDPNRLVPATQAQTRLPALLDAAAAGHATHIVDNERVLAHLLPADALVLTPDIEEALLGTAVRAEAARFSGEIENAGYHHVGNTIGQMFSWLWQSSSDSAISWVARYATELADALAARRIGRPPFDPFWKAVRIALDIDAPDTAVQDFETALRTRLHGFTDLFTAAELAGDTRHRDADDPWPDTTAAGRCFAKKRWSDVRVGDFVPPHQGVDLDYDDGWCRIERLDAGQAVLRDATGQHFTSQAPDDTTWLPTRGREPWQWGMPL